MKNTKKFAAMMAALTLSACSIVPVSSLAAIGTGNNSITISNSDDATHTYEAYQIFAGDYSENTLSNIVWGDGVDGDAILSALQLDGTLASYFTGCNSAGDVADKLASKDGGSNPIFGDNSDLTKAFVKIVGKNLTTTTSGSYSAGEITELPDGYYLIQDESKPTGGTENTGAKTRFIVNVVGGGKVSVTAKSSAPTVVKKVKENSDISSDYSYSYGSPAQSLTDTDYNDIADYNIGDSVPFKLYGTLPSTYADYEHYYYKFTDNLGTEFTIADNAKFKISVNGGEKVTLTLDANKKAYDYSTGTDIFIDAFDNKNITITIEDVKELTTNASDVITVEYEATLNSNAQIGLNGQVNGVMLDYSNNPNIEYNPKYGDDTGNSKDTPESPTDENGNKETGETPWDGVIVFTYGIDINKVQEDNKTKLADAKFALYKKSSTGETYIAVDGDGKITELSEAPTKDTIVGAENGVWQSNGTDNIEINGLDAGEYYITELEAPAGYNKLSSDIKFIVNPTMAIDRQAWTYSSDKSTADTALTDLDIKYGDVASNIFTTDAGATASAGKGTITIVNKQGTALPSTGGIGTSIFYLGGGCMVAVAGIFLITKKRMSKREN